MQNDTQDVLRMALELMKDIVADLELRAKMRGDVEDGKAVLDISNGLLVRYDELRALSAQAQQVEVAQALTLENAPIGTKAPACNGGHWYRTERGWKWNGPDGNGGTFPRPGGDWNGKLIASTAQAPGKQEWQKAYADLRRLIADDAYAISFQSMGQYRSALLKNGGGNV